MPSAGPSPVPALSGGLNDFFTGFTLPLTSLKVMVRSGKVLGLSLFASVVTAAALIALIVGLWPLGARFAHWLVGENSFGTVLSILFYGLMLVVAALTVPALLLSPLQDPISEATEGYCGDYAAPSFSMGRLLKSTGTSVAHTASRLSILMIGFAVMLPLNFVPVAGSALYALVTLIWATWWLTAEYVSGPFARHLVPFRQVLRAMRARKLACFGFGLALYVLLWVPILNFFLVPIAVVGGTLLFRALRPHVP